MSIRKYAYYFSSIFTLLTGLRPWRQVLQIFLSPSRPQDALVEIRQSGVRFRTRGAMDIWSVKETYLDRFYERYGTPVGAGWTVVDVGGGIGEFTLLAALAHPSNRVYAFEPTPQSFALLQENLRLNGVRNVQAFQEAIWSGSGTLVIDTTAGEPSQFTSGQVEAGGRDGRLLVPSLSLAEAFDRLGIRHCDLLKLDCEGAEYPILFSLPDSALQCIERIVMEYHDGVTGHNHTDLVTFLQGKGFQVETFANFVHRDLGYLHAFRK